MRLRDTLHQHREAIRQAAAKSGARDVRVFGSVARGEEHEGSDIDFVVALEPGRTLRDLARLELRLEEILGRPVEVLTEAELTPSLRASALRDAIHV